MLCFSVIWINIVISTKKICVYPPPPKKNLLVVSFYFNIQNQKNDYINKQR